MMRVGEGAIDDIFEGPDFARRSLATASVLNIAIKKQLQRK